MSIVEFELKGKLTAYGKKLLQEEKELEKEEEENGKSV